MRLTLDLDRIGKRKLKGVISLLHRIFPDSRIVARISPGGSGRHVIVYGTGLNWEEIKKHRRLIGDDTLRRLIDSGRYSCDVETQILFKSKRGGVAKQIYDERVYRPDKIV